MPTEERVAKIMSLTRQNEELRMKLSRMKREFDTHMEIETMFGRTTDTMPRATRVAIDKVLHPDSQPTDADKLLACQGWNAWKNSNDKARRK
jgi:chromatin segregation and condensation protein Rec8/ScpA/Scc1 (kleisin family)